MKLSNEEIAAKDLRVGNLLNKDGIVVCIDARSILDISYNYSEACKYKPIPLTPEILLKGGFVGHYMGKSFGGATYSVYKLKGIWVYVYSDGRLRVYSGSGSKEHKWILYVHQLQNLYYSLTGEELDLGIAISKNEVK